MSDRAKPRYILPANKSPASTSPSNSLAATLEELSTTNIKMVNERDFELSSPAAKAVLEHVSPHFKTWMYNVSKPTALTFEEGLEVLRSVAKNFPKYREEILGLTTDIEEKRGCATVVVHVRISGREQTSVEAIREAKWERDEHGKWWLHSFIGIWGVSMDG